MLEEGCDMMLPVTPPAAAAATSSSKASYMMNADEVIPA